MSLACLLVASRTDADAVHPRTESRDAGPAPIRGPRTAEEQVMFEFLTSFSWCGESCFDTTSGPWFGSCGVTEFRKDGGFRSAVHSDIIEVEAEGDWDLILENAASGRIRVGGTNEYLFERRGQELWLAGAHLRRCRDAPPGPPGGSVADLRPVVSPALLDTLCAHDWVKEDDFDLYCQPLRIHFDREFRCVSQFRDRSCVQTGRFSVIGHALRFEPQTPACGDLRGGPASPGSAVAFVGSALALDGVRYLPAPSDRSHKRSPAMCGNGSLCIDLSYDGELRWRKRTPLHLRFWNDAGRPVRLRSLRVSLQPLSVVPLALDASGPEYTIASRAYDHGPLAPNDSLSEVVDLVPPIRGEVVGLVLAWDYEDASGVHHCRAQPVVRIP